jgi:hypothetical protein
VKPGQENVAKQKHDTNAKKNYSKAPQKWSFISEVHAHKDQRGGA